MSQLPPLRAQQHATRSSFFIAGFGLAAWAPLVPFAKQNTGLDDGSLGLLLLCLGCGSFVAMPLAGALAARHGCRRILLLAMALVCLTLPLLTLAGSPWALALTLLAFGAGIGTLDCTTNIHAVMVERDSDTAMMSGFHAFYSIGGLAGAASMTALLSAGLVPWHAASGLVACLLVLAAFSAASLRTDRAPAGGARMARPRGMVLVIGLLCFAAFLAEGAVLDWGAVFLTEAKAVPASYAGASFVVFSTTMTLTRLLGDRIVGVLGHRRAITIGGLGACAGFVLAALAPDWPLALVGYGVVGIGCANIVPALFSLAGRQTTMPDSQAIPAITTLGYLGILAGPALIGFVAHATSLPTAFFAVAGTMMVVAAAMRWMPRAI